MVYGTLMAVSTVYGLIDGGDGFVVVSTWEFEWVKVSGGF